MDPLSDGKAATSHNITIPAGYLASMGENQTRFYIRCEPANIEGCDSGQPSSVDYIIKFDIHTGPDTTAPILEYIEPQPAYAAYDKDTKDVTLHVNEVLTWNTVLNRAGGCRWSDQNVEYDSMSTENATLCDDPGVGDYSQECTTTLTGLTQGTNSIYFACCDPAGNNMTYDPYIVTKTTSLNITSFIPESNDCVFGNGINCYTNNLSLKAETVGGAELGKASCSWSQTESGTQIPFFTTNSTTHEQPNLNFYTTGDYTYYATCTDIAENTATNSTTFTINVDTTAPVLTGVSHDLQFGKLKITVEDENSVTCQYSNTEFFLPNGKDMSSIGNAFYADWGLGLYYIRCEDKFGNEMPLAIIHTSALK